MASPKSVFVSPGLGTCQMLSTELSFIVSKEWARQDFLGNSYNVKVHRSYNGLICPENMKQLPFIVSELWHTLWLWPIKNIQGEGHFQG